MQNSVRRNVMYNALYQGLLLFIPFALTPYLTRTLGSTGLGVYSYHYSCTYYFIMLAMLGLRNYGSRCIARVSGDRDERSKMFASIYALQLCTGGAAVGLYSAYVLLFTQRDILPVLMGGFVLACAFDVAWFFNGIEKFDLIILRNTLVRLMTLICTLLFVRHAQDVALYACIVAGGTLLSNLFVLAGTRRYIRWQRPTAREVGRHLKPNLILFAASFSVSLYTCMDKIMLGQMAGMGEVGLYASSERLLNLPMLLPSVLNTVMLPHMSHLSGHGEKERETELLDRSLQCAMLAASAVCFGIAATADQIVPLFFGKGFEKCALLLALMMPSRLFVCFTNIIHAHYLMPYGRDWLCLASRLLGALVNITANLLLIPRGASVGAAAATLLAEAAVCGMQCWYIRRDVPIRRYIAHCMPYIGAGLAMWAVLGAAGRYMAGGVLLRLLLKVGLGAAVYGLLLLAGSLCLGSDFLVGACAAAVLRRAGSRKKGR